MAIISNTIRERELDMEGGGNFYFYCREGSRFESGKRDIDKCDVWCDLEIAKESGVSGTRMMSTEPFVCCMTQALPYAPPTNITSQPRPISRP